MTAGAFSGRLGRFRAAWGAPDDVALVFDHLRAERGDVLAELTVLDTHGPAEAAMFHARLNLLAARARQDVARALEDRTPAQGLAWPEKLDAACLQVVQAYRAGDPPIRLADIAPPEHAGYVLGSLLLEREPVALFADGGSAKSLIGLAMAGALATGGTFAGMPAARPMRVGYADWEFSGEEHRQRADRLFGAPLPELLYVRCSQPIGDEVERLQRIIRDHGLEYLVVDSVGAACGGPPESAEYALAFFRALRRLEVGSLCLAHVTKADGGDQKPFGSVFFSNMARSTWYAKRSSDSDGARLAIGLYHRKANTGPLRAPIGLEVTFDDPFGPITIERADVRDMADLAAKLPISSRLPAALRDGAHTIVEIAGDLDADVEAVRLAVKRAAKAGRVRSVVGLDGITRWGLADETHRPTPVGNGPTPVGRPTTRPTTGSVFRPVVVGGGPLDD
jgi:hypothetical protein